ncbi:hypothetical protein ABZY31_25485 [Streptomyces sp. NPDC006529]|uniref:hypothetical protein n=1 Tax=Streptomyces sp. NPDC006529 TaxID=3157177 RepID=UPI0033A988CA
MELPSVAGHGVGERADALAEAACHLYDAAFPGGWSRTAAEDAAEAIETTAHALAHVHPGAEVVLAPVHVALAALRRRLELPPPDTGIASGVPQTPRSVGNPRRTRRPHGLIAPRRPPTGTGS